MVVLPGTTSTARRSRPRRGERCGTDPRLSCSRSRLPPRLASGAGVCKQGSPAASPPTLGEVVDDSFDRDSWERRWSEALRDGAHAVARRPPNAHLLAEAADLPPGLALDAGAGHGAETLWLAARGWRVTAVEFSARALGHARVSAERLGVDAAQRIDWIEADLATWTPPPDRYDLE